MTRWLVALAVAGAAVSAAQPAHAFVRTVTARGCNPVHWSQSCVYVTVDADGSTDMPLADVERITRTAMESWSTPTDDGSFLRLLYVAADGPREVASDGMQVVEFRSQTWCRPADVPGGEPICYDHAATAITTLSYIADPSDPSTDGRITDADIELNAVDNAFYDATSGAPAPATSGRRRLDLWNTLTHELGHLQGLDHTCRRPGETMPACTVDDRGGAVPSCADVDVAVDANPTMQAIHDATMYPSTKADEISKRTPKDDDVHGVLAAYPLASDPKVCRMPGDGVAAVDAEPPAERGAASQGGCSVIARGANRKERADALAAAAALLFALTLRGRGLRRRTRR